jgi:tyrosine decarboxylase
LGDLLSSGLGQQGMMWLTSPALTEVEETVMDWCVDLFGLPKEFLMSSKTGGGVLQGTASETVIVTLLAAKYRTGQLHKVDSQLDFDLIQKIVVYSSDQTHSSIKRGCIIAGIPLEHYRVIPADASTEYALDPVKLEQAIQKDLADGLYPCAVISCVGTTGCCAYDPIDKISVVAKKYNLWHHVDAAYAGVSFVCPELRVPGIQDIDSFNTNAHKWLLVGFDCSLYWTKDKGSLIKAMSVYPEYLRNKATEQGSNDYKDWGIPLGRRFRALKLWFVIRTYGIKGLQNYIREHLHITDVFEQSLSKDPRFIIIRRKLGLVLFVLKNDEDQIKTKILMDKVNESGEFFLTHCALGPYKFVIRMAIGSISTRLEHVQNCLKRIIEITNDLVPLQTSKL